MSDSGTETKTAFIISQIGAADSPERRRADHVRDYVIRPACDEHGIRAKRADENHQPGQITAAIVESIIESDIVVVDLTGKNLNVYYELGIAHAYSRPTALLIDDTGDLPFDVKDERTVPIGSAGTTLGADDAAKATAALAAQLGHLIDPEFTVQNLVTRAAGYKRLDQVRITAGPEEPIGVMASQIEQLVEEVGALRAVLGRPVSHQVDLDAARRQPWRFSDTVRLGPRAADRVGYLRESIAVLLDQRSDSGATLESRALAEGRVSRALHNVLADQLGRELTEAETSAIMTVVKDKDRLIDLVTSSSTALEEDLRQVTLNRSST